jgi:hypothetical protein
VEDTAVAGGTTLEAIIPLELTFLNSHMFDSGLARSLPNRPPARDSLGPGASNKGPTRVRFEGRRCQALAWIGLRI